MISIYNIKESMIVRFYDNYRLSFFRESLEVLDYHTFILSPKQKRR